MASITTQGVSGGGMIYTWSGFTGEQVACRVPLPEEVEGAFGLTVVSASPDGSICYQRNPGTTATECLLTREQVWIHGKQTARYGAALEGEIGKPMLYTEATKPLVEAVEPPVDMVAGNGGAGEAQGKDRRRIATGMRPRQWAQFLASACGLEARCVELSRKGWRFSKGKAQEVDYVDIPYPPSSKAQFRDREQRESAAWAAIQGRE